jgi:oxygen-independent coproporphyrinogen-3 oxidase
MDEYLVALGRQVEQVRPALGAAAFVRFAIGGGTPTALDVKGLTDLLDLGARLLGPAAGRIPASVETSPETAEVAKLALLRQYGVTRISLGVQSFLEAETAAVGRPQKLAAVLAALDRIREQGFPVLNIDLIYGLPEQTTASWIESVHAALRFRPEELYLYPLYVRPLTGLGRSRRSWDDDRLAFYREARDLLRAEGYQQVSMRMFRAGHSLAEDGPVYCCQNDGMVGLGCGARSYTRSVHYSGHYAVRAAGVREVIANYIAQPAAAFATTDYGFRLNADEQRRRYVVQSLLLAEGLSLSAYGGRFGTDAWTDLPQLAELEPRGLARATEDRLALTDAGLERSDAIGPWLYSSVVRTLMEAYEWH